MESVILVAAQYGQSDVLQTIRNTLPPLAPGMARISVKAAGINPIDARRMTGEFKHSALPQAFGTEFAGVISELPPGTQGWAIGDDVLGSGNGFTHATVIDVPLSNLIRKPKDMRWDVAGSLAGAAQTAMTILDELGEISSLLIHGASGGVGSILIQLAQEREIKVVATASERNQDYLRAMGASATVYGPGLVERLRLIQPQPFDASVDMSGTEEATLASLATVKADGIVATIAGKPVSSPRVQAIWVKRNPKNLQHVVDGLATGQLTWEVSQSFPFSKARDAYAAVLGGHTRGKSVLIFD
ncbi:NADP-dependent oxidoreductase [Devosia sp. MC532]|uniref:NADP-dependent oxidoreductase n=1 Tax=Devosia sp. MC532 TaxID=2799788 RepID=UPI0018F34E1C|nr:NADP-dependent oxidoreductase [Devosia sp. MC532]MBJ7577872.1 NADP-dependent oxidoreductase [Devosia sp. MC532]